MNSDHKIEKIRNLLEHLLRMLKEHRGSNHVAGVQSAIRELSNDEVMPDERIRNARSIFRSMMGGMGTLGDFAIGDGDEATQASLNHELNELLTELWNRLEC